MPMVAVAEPARQRRGGAVLSGLVDGFVVVAD